MGLADDERVEDGECRWRMIQPILWEAEPCLMFIGASLALMWNMSHQIFVYLERCTSYRVSRHQEDSMRQISSVC